MVVLLDLRVAIKWGFVWESIVIVMICKHLRYSYYFSTICIDFEQ